MKKIICIFLSVLMIVSFASCGETVKDKENQEQEAASDTEGGENDQIDGNEPTDAGEDIDVTLVTAKKDPIGTIWLCESGEGNSSVSSFYTAGEYGISTSNKKYSFSKLEGTQKVFGEEKTVLRYKNSDCCLKSSDSEEFGSFYCITDDYSSDDNTLEVSYLHGTDVISGYFKTLSSEIRNDTNESLTDEDMQEMAYSFLKTMYSEELLEGYSFEGVKRYDQLNIVTVTFRIYVEGYKTDDSIGVMLTEAGVPFSVNADNIGKYNYTDPVTKEDLDQAKEVLLEKVASLGLPGLSHSEEALKLTTDTSGKVYLETWFTFTVGDEGEKMMESLYVNVN